jgi:septum formation topological specificity factor MinE
MQSNISKRIAAEKAITPDAATGLLESQKDEIAQALAIAEAEARIAADALPEEKKDMILQELRADVFNIARRYVKLTPSMCDIRGCAWDAAKEIGSTDWHAIPTDQMMPDGKTLGERLQAMLAYHKSTSHTYAAQNDHIISQEELRRRQWGPGQEVHLVGVR